MPREEGTRSILYSPKSGPILQSRDVVGTNPPAVPEKRPARLMPSSKMILLTEPQAPEPQGSGK